MACPVLSGSVAILTFRKSPHLIPTWLGKFFQVAESESSSGTFSWNTANHADGMYQIEALTYDPSGNVGEAHTLQVYAWDEAGNVSASQPVTVRKK